MKSDVKKEEMLQIATNLEVLAKKSETCFELYDKILNRTQEVALSVVAALERARVSIDVFGFSYLKCKYNNYLMYEGHMLEGYTSHKGGGYDGGDFNYWVPGVSRIAIFACAKAIENGLIKDATDYIQKSIDEREALLEKLNDVEC